LRFKRRRAGDPQISSSGAAEVWVGACAAAEAAAPAAGFGGGPSAVSSVSF